MYRSLQAAPPASKPQRPDAVAVVLFKKTSALPPGYQDLDRQTGGALQALLTRSEFTADKGTLTTLYPAAGDVGRLFVLGLGEREKFNGEALRIAAAKLVRGAFAAKVTRVRLLSGAAFNGTLSAEAAGRAIADGIAIANFDFNRFKGAAGGKSANGNDDGTGKPAGKNDKPLDLTVEVEDELREAFERGLRIGESVNVTRALAATPPNVANPQYLADYARTMAREVGLTCRVIQGEEAQRLGMGGLLAVGAAGSQPPAMIILEWKGAGAKAQGPAKTRKASRSAGPSALGPGPILLVGKAVTFDTGGISIKPAENMDKMKYDKSGGMTVIGAMHAVARLKLPRHVVGIIPAAENMLGQTAYRPGDIVTFCNGVTGEILNTDAEGRVILADALAYGTREYKPQAVVDLATLTGACVVALGNVCAGAFCGNMTFRSHLFDAAEFTGERLWHMPLWDEHRQQIKGTHGDIVNTGGREAGACTAAAFLSFFIEPDGKTRMPALPWCHLDIAGVSDVKRETALYQTGPTGFGVRLLVRALETWQDIQPKRDVPAQPGGAAGLDQGRAEGARQPVGTPVRSER